MTARTIEKITVVVVVAVLGVALAVNIHGPPVALLVAVLAITVSAGMDLVLRGEARYRPTPDLFILPAALVVGAVLFLSLPFSGPQVVVGFTVFGALLFGIFWAEHNIRLGLVDQRVGETVLIVTGYVAAFVLYAAVYQYKTRSLVSAPAIITITFLLAARQLRLAHEPLKPGEDEAPAQAGQPGQPGQPGHTGEPAEPAARPLVTAPPWPRTLLYSAVVALAVGEVTWALNYWPLNGLLGGAFLLSAFYFLVGIFSQHLQDRLTGRLVAEYGAVALVGTLLIAASGLFGRGP